MESGKASGGRGLISFGFKARADQKPSPITSGASGAKTVEKLSGERLYRKRDTSSSSQDEKLPLPKRVQVSTSQISKRNIKVVHECSEKQKIYKEAEEAYRSAMNCVVKRDFRGARRVIDKFHSKEGMEWDSVRQFCKQHEYKWEQEKIFLDLESLDQSIDYVKHNHKDMYEGVSKYWGFNYTNDYQQYHLELYREATVFVHSLLLNNDYLENLPSDDVLQVCKVANQFLLWALKSRRLSSRAHSLWMDAYNTLSQRVAQDYPDEIETGDFIGLAELNKINSSIASLIDVSAAFGIVIKEYEKLRKNNFDSRQCLRLVCASRFFSERFLHFETIGRSLLPEEDSIKKKINVIFYGCCILVFGPRCFYMKSSVTRGGKSIQIIDLVKHLSSLGRLCVPPALMCDVMKPVVRDINYDSRMRNDNDVSIALSKECGVFNDNRFITSLELINDGEFKRATEILDEIEDETGDFNKGERLTIQFAHIYRYCKSGRDSDAYDQLKRIHMHEENYSFYAVCNLLVMCGHYDEAESKIEYLKRYLHKNKAQTDLRILPFKELLSQIEDEKAHPAVRKRLRVTKQPGSRGLESDEDECKQPVIKKVKTGLPTAKLEAAKVDICRELPPVAMADKDLQTILTCADIASFEKKPGEYEAAPAKVDMFAADSDTELSQELRQELSLLKGELSHAHQELAGANDHIVCLRDEIDALNYESECVKSSYLSHVQELQDRADKLEQEKSTLQTCIAKLDKRIEGVKNEKTQAVSKHAEMEKQYKNYEKMYGDLMALYKSKSEELKVLQREQSESRIKYKRVTRPSTSLPVTSTASNQSQVKLEPIGEAHTAAVSSYETRIKALNDELEKVRKDLADAESQIREWKGRYENVNRNRAIDHDELSKEIMLLKESKAELSKEWNAERNNIESQREQYKSRAYRAELCVRDLEKTIKESESLLNEKDASLTQLNTSFSEAKEQTATDKHNNQLAISRLEDRVRDLEEESHREKLEHMTALNHEKTKFETLQQQLESSARAKAEKENELDEKTAVFHKLKQELLDKNVTIQMLEAEQDNLKRDVKAANEEVASAASFKMQEQDLREALQSEKNRVSESERREREHELKISEQKRLLDDLRRQLGEMKTTASRLSEMNEKVNRLERSKMETESRCSVLSEQLRGKETEIELQKKLFAQQENTNKALTEEKDLQARMHHQQMEALKADIARQASERANVLMKDNAPKIMAMVRQRVLQEQQSASLMQSSFPQGAYGQGGAVVQEELVHRRSVMNSGPGSQYQAGPINFPPVSSSGQLSQLLSNVPGPSESFISQPGGDGTGATPFGGYIEQAMSAGHPSGVGGVTPVPLLATGDDSPPPPANIPPESFMGPPDNQGRVGRMAQSRYEPASQTGEQDESYDPYTFFRR